MTELKKYQLTSNQEQQLCDYLCGTFDFDFVDNELSSLFIDKIMDIDKLISVNPQILTFLADVVYNGLMNFHNINNNDNENVTQFYTIDTFKEHYYIDTTNLFFIFNVVISHYKNVHKSKTNIYEVSHID